MVRFKEWHALSERHPPEALRTALGDATARGITSAAEHPPGEYDRLIRYRAIEIGGYTAQYERWVWDGVYGSTLIFSSKDVAHLSDAALRTLVEGAGYTLDGETTRTERHGQVFFNFGFET